MMKRWDKEEIAKLECFLNQNLTLEVIGEKLGRSNFSVFKKTSSLGYEKQWVKKTKIENKVKKHNHNLKDCFENISNTK